MLALLDQGHGGKAKGREAPRSAAKMACMGDALRRARCPGLAWSIVTVKFEDGDVPSELGPHRRGPWGGDRP